MFLVLAVLRSRWAQPGGDSIVEQCRIESSEGQKWSCRSITKFTRKDGGGSKAPKV